MSHKRESEILHRTLGPKFEAAVIEANGFIAGGAVRSVFSSDRIVDLDIFFENQASFDLCVKTLQGNEHSPSFSITESAWTHIGVTEGDDETHRMRYQLICAEFGTPQEILAKFDFTMCKAAWDVATGHFVFDELFLKHVAQKRLCFNPHAIYPICSLWRAAKFIKRGWRLPGIEAIKLALAIHNIKIDDRKDLKDQLMGIDTIFLAELTDGLKTNPEAKYDFGEAIEYVMGFMDDED